MTVFIKVENLGLRYQISHKLSLRPRSARMTGGSLGVRADKSFVQALDGLNFELHEGDRLGLVGPNGAGKSTLLKVLYGIYQPTEGGLTVTGRVDALFNINLGFRKEATGRRNIELRGLINGWTMAQVQARMDDIIDFSELGEFIDLPFKAYSQGMAARLAFSVATTMHPEILLMDEWIGAGDARFREKASERMNAITEHAGIVVIASHDDKLIKRVCNKVLSIKGGKMHGLISVDEYLAQA